MSSKPDDADADEAMPLTSKRREEIVLALLSTTTTRAAAKLAGIGERRLYRLLNDPEFAKAYVTARRAAFKSEIAKLSSLVEVAVETLRKAMGCKNWPVRVRAAIAVIERAYAWIELEDFEARLQGIERNLGILKDERIAADQGLQAVEPERREKLDSAERAELEQLRREKLISSGQWEAPPAGDHAGHEVLDLESPSAAPPPLFNGQTDEDLRP